MVQLKQTAQSHVAAVIASAGSRASGATVVLNPAAADVAAASSGPAGAHAFVDASGKVLTVWAQSNGLVHSDFLHAWELVPYINNIFNHIQISSAGMWSNAEAHIGQMTPAAYLAAYGAKMTA